MATHRRTELVLDALDRALGQRRPATVVHPLHHGTQHTSRNRGNASSVAACLTVGTFVALRSLTS